jgi:uncharacterized repeat protein (TIGR01451 family)
MAKTASTTPALTGGTEATATFPLGNVTVAVTTPASTTAPAKLGDVVPITVTITNTGPIAVDGVTITPPAGVNFAGTVCAAPVNTTAATNDAPTPVTCVRNYTVVTNDVLSATKALAFVVTIADSAKLKTPVTTPQTITVPLTNLTTSFTAADCVPVAPATGSEWQLDMKLATSAGTVGFLWLCSACNVVLANRPMTES